MASATDPGGQKSFRRWIHLHLSSTEKPWCLEWPAAYAESARLCLMLTTEHPELLASPCWNLNLQSLLDAAIADAEQGGDLTPVAWLFAVLQLHAESERSTGQGADALAGLMETCQTRIPPELLDQLVRARPRGQGRRLAPGTLADHDAVERLRHADPELPTNDARLVSVAEQHTSGTDSGFMDRTGPYAAVKKHHQRVRARAVPLPYVLLPCQLHTGTPSPIPVHTPDPAWQDLPTPDLATLHAARTITFRPRVLLPDAENPPLILREGTTWRSPPE